MAEYWRVTRLYLVLLALVTAGRWFVSFRVPYEVATDKLSIVVTTLFASLLFAAFCRRWRRYGVVQAMVLGAIFGLLAQVVIFVSTALSYALDLETYFNYYKALQAEPGPVPFQLALARRAGGLIAGPISNAMVGLLGWALGALLPAEAK
jgi:hypothetical protein